MKKGQTLSTDAIVAVVIFILGAMLLFYILGPSVKNKHNEKLQADALRLPGIFGSGQNLSIAFLQGIKVDVSKLHALILISYDNLKSLLGIESEFCIYFEDDKGFVVPAGDKVGIGSSFVNLSGKACNETII